MGHADDLLDDVYTELKAVAGRYTAPGQSMEPTDLVHEVFLRLRDRSWESLRHFRVVASVAMRQVIIDHARRKRTTKRGGDRVQVTLSRLGVEMGCFDLIDLDRALQQLTEMDARKGKVVTMRIFGGLQLGEIAEELAISTSTVKREWRTARAWLMSELG